MACGGNNAIAAVRRNGSGWRVAGALPTAWFPSAIALDAEGGLRILNIKGIGNTDNKKGGFNSRQYEGSLERIPAPTPLQLESGAREVKAANMPMYEPAGGVANLSSLGIQHVFLIVKENRTYDQVFGDMPKGNGDPKLAIYGKETTPNHHALGGQIRAARQLLHGWGDQLRRSPVANAGVRQRLRGAGVCRLAARVRVQHVGRPGSRADRVLLAELGEAAERAAVRRTAVAGALGPRPAERH